MAHEFKKLSDVEIVTSPSDNTNVLIEEDGVIRKMPKSEMSGGVKVASTAEVGQTLVVRAVDENGKPTEWECVDFAQADWNQNDSTAKDYVKNRPFYEEETRIYLQEQTIVTLDSNGYGTYELETSLKQSQTYTIVWDGVAYESKVFSNVDADDVANIEINGESLKIINSYSFQGTASMEGEHTLEIYMDDTAIKQLDKKYIPSSIIEIEDIIVNHDISKISYSGGILEFSKDTDTLYLLQYSTKTSELFDFIQDTSHMCRFIVDLHDKLRIYTDYEILNQNGTGYFKLGDVTYDSV